MLGNIGFSELMILMVVVLLVFGAKRLPEIGSSIGKGIREFKRSLTDTQDAITRTEDPASLPPRHIDNVQATPTGGEPKRLSQ